MRNIVGFGHGALITTLIILGVLMLCGIAGVGMGLAADWMVHVWMVR